MGGLTNAVVMVTIVKARMWGRDGIVGELLWGEVGKMCCMEVGGGWVWHGGLVHVWGLRR